MATTIGVLGSGQMGAGIAQTAAQTGFTVLLADQSKEIAEKAIESIRKRILRLVEKEKISEADAHGVMERIRAVSGMGDFSKADLVVEAASENIDLKLKLFKELDQAAGANAILASNTSSILSLIHISEPTRPY